MPPKFESIMEDVDVNVGQTSRLAVVVEGKPDPDILWYKVGTLQYTTSTATSQSNFSTIMRLFLYQ